jgi:hypothetical protein
MSRCRADSFRTATSELAVVGQLFTQYINSDTEQTIETTAVAQVQMCGNEWRGDELRVVLNKWTRR